MRDIIDECEISRGGVYVYFRSVDEVFLEVMTRRNEEKFSQVNDAVQSAAPFEKILSDYLARQKKRLLNFKGSLFRAYCEYIFSRPKEAVEAFRDVQFGHLRKTVLKILMLGVHQGVIRRDDEKIPSIAEHIIVTIDGLRILALAEAVTEKMIDDQFALLLDMLEPLKSGAVKQDKVKLVQKLI